VLLTPASGLKPRVSDNMNEANIFFVQSNIVISTTDMAMEAVLLPKGSDLAAFISHDGVLDAFVSSLTLLG
jgi:hypothetical protein